LKDKQKNGDWSMKNGVWWIKWEDGVFVSSDNGKYSEYLK